jgi:two-component system sensor histidine kinase EvgS
MSHEIRTPLHAVMGFARLLRERPLDDGAAALLAQVSAASGHLIAVVDDALDLSLVDAGHLRLQEAPFHLADVLRRLTPIAAMAGEGKSIAFRWRVDPRIPAWLCGDERRLFQILVNLVGNAHKFTERGEVVLEATLVEFSGGPRLRIDVRDTGRGVDLATVTELFESFARGPGTEGTPGAGLGLAIVKQLVDMMDGDLEVGCGARGGASFAFVLPLRPAEPPRTPAPLSATPALRVLLADDTPSSRLLAQAMLEARGHHVVAVADGREALEARRRGRFDLVLLDLQMPNMGGLEAAARLRAEEGRGPHAFMAALTAQTFAGDGGAIDAAGMDGVLRKPFGPLELEALLARAAKAVSKTTSQTTPSAAQAPKDV